MPLADSLRQKALSLAEAGVPLEDGILELLDSCQGRRVSVVLAGQQLHADLAARGSDPVIGRAVEMVDATLERLPMM